MVVVVEGRLGWGCLGGGGGAGGMMEVGIGRLKGCRFGRGGGCGRGEGKAAVVVWEDEVVGGDGRRNNSLTHFSSRKGKWRKVDRGERERGREGERERERERESVSIYNPKQTFGRDLNFIGSPSINTPRLSLSFLL